MTPKLLRVGVVGAGANTKQLHIPRLNAIDGVRVTHVANRSLDSSQRAAAEFNIPHACASWRDVVECPDVDAVMIGTWPYMHCEVTVAALRAGKHVLCEARMARNMQEAAEMLAAARSRPDLVAQLVPAPFTLWQDATIKRMIDECFLGNLLVVNVRGSPGAFLDKRGPLNWRMDRELSGNNVMMMGIFYETLARWVGGASSLVARGRVFVHTRDKDGVPRPSTIPEHVDIIADMECGAQAHFQMSSVMGLAPAMDFWLHGDEGTIHVDVGKGLFAGRRGEKLRPVEVLRPEPPALENGWRVEEEFVGAVRGTELIRNTTFEDGIRYMEFTDAVARSLATGRTAAEPVRSRL